MSVLFISDLHLDAGLPAIGQQFSEFVNANASDCDALYILGDLFESWVGDDDPQPERGRLVDSLKTLRANDTPVYFMHGNRDFLLGEQFAAQAGMELLDEEVVHTIHGTPVLLMHGDSLCTDDHEYQAFRSMVRDPAWQQQFLAMPLEQRLAAAREARARSRERNANAPEQIMDVNQQAVESALRRHQVDVLLHGHTHRPAVHEFRHDGVEAKRIVLGDWYDHGSVVRWDADGPLLESLPRADARC